MAEERVEEAHAMAKADDMRVQKHAEIASALILGVKLQRTIREEGLGVFQPRPQTRGREHQEKLIVEMIVVGQGQHGTRRLDLRHPVVGNVVGETVPHILIAGIDQPGALAPCVVPAATRAARGRRAGGWGNASRKRGFIFPIRELWAWTGRILCQVFQVSARSLHAAAYDSELYRLCFSVHAAAAAPTALGVRRCYIHPGTLSLESASGY